MKTSLRPQAPPNIELLIEKPIYQYQICTVGFIFIAVLRMCVTFVNAAGNVSSFREEGCNAEFLRVSWGEQEAGLDCCLCRGN